MAGIVWILGAGFSMPLGAPSFAGLISEATRVQSEGLFPEESRGWAHAVESVYESGLPTRERPLDTKGLPRELGAQLWRDPEEFLELVELAQGNLGAAQASLIAERVWRKAPQETYRTYGSMTNELRRECLEDLRREGTRFCAAACTAFLDVAESDPSTVLQTEKWEPYARWKRELLVRGDTVITFNWDRVLDLLAQKGGVEISALLPGHRSIGADEIPVFHLHGHVNWQVASNNPLKVYRDEDRLAAVKRASSAVLGTPGGTKKATAETLLLELWQQACQKINTADQVVFIGYRFPPSDNMSKRALLGALKTSNVNRIHVVLGPRSLDAPRLKGLLKWTDHQNGLTRDIAVHEMGSEDFLAVVERRHL